MPDLDRTAGQRPTNFYAGLPAGSSLGGYELKSILGQGAFGITYRARHPDQEHDVAIKEYLPATLAMRQDRTTVIPRSDDLAEQFAWGRTRFLEEAGTLKKLDGTPSVVGVHDFFEANGTAYMVMDLIEGETLAKRLVREERLAAGLVEPLLFPLLDGLEKVHAAGFLHRDIKPANIMIDMQGKPTLIDFGASRAALAGRTTTFTAIFTPGYAAVEQFASNKLRPSADIYGLAATLYHAISGHAPPSAIERVLKDEYQPLVELQPAGYSLAFLESIDAALAVSSADRPQSVGEWRRMLASSLEATRIARSPGRLARAASRTRRARVSLGVPAIGLAGALAVVVLGAAGYFAFTTSTPAPPPPTVSTAAQGLTAEQLEQALAERRKADAQAADMARREDEARQKAQAEAEAKRQADQALQQARQARLQADQELAELNARLEAQRRENADQASRAAAEEAQRKAEQDAAALAEAEERAKQKAAADAEAKRQADEALMKAEAERQRAEQEARQKADAEQAALRQASEEAQRKAAEADSVKQAELERLKAEAEREKAQAERQKAEAEAKAKAEAETSEKALRLEQTDRQRLQVALTSLGFDTRGSDGVFGPRSREMIAGWQKKAGAPPTGFLTAAQREQLLRAAAPAVARWDEAQKKSDEDKITTEAAKSSAAASPASTSPTTPTRPPSPLTHATGAQPPSTNFDGTYSGSLRISGGAGTTGRVDVSLLVTKGSGLGTLSAAGCSPSRFKLALQSDGKVSGEGHFNCIAGYVASMQHLSGAFTIGGSHQGTSLMLTFQSERGSPISTVLSKSTTTASTTVPSPDGLWRGTYQCEAAHASSSRLSFEVEVQVVKGVGSWKASPDARNGNTVDLSVSIAGGSITMTRSSIGWNFNIGQRVAMISGLYDGGNTIQVGGVDTGPPLRDCVLKLQR